MLEDEFFLGNKLYHKKFTKLCKPISEYLGITQAAYINVDKHGGMFNTSTNCKWAERFLEQKYYKLDPWMVHPNNIHNGFSFDNSVQDPEFRDIMVYDAITNFNWNSSFVYVEKDKNGYFGFCFGTDKNNYNIVNRLINEAQIIKKIIRNLNRELLYSCA